MYTVCEFNGQFFCDVCAVWLWYVQLELGAVCVQFACMYTIYVACVQIVLGVCILYFVCTVRIGCVDVVLYVYGLC